MTRINVGIDPELLVDKHLLAEIRELPRVYGLVEKRLEKGTLRIAKLPKEFTLNAGHVLFFYNKFGFLFDRYDSLINEYNTRFKKREDNVGRLSSDWFYAKIINLPAILFQDYKPTEKDRNLLVERISERLKTMKNLKYKQQPISVEDAIALLKKEKK